MPREMGRVVEEQTRPGLLRPPRAGHRTSRLYGGWRSIPVQTRFLFRGHRHRFRSGTRRTGFAVFRLPLGLCLRGVCRNELPQKFPAAGVDWGASAAATRYRGCAEREGPRNRHPLHRGKVGSPLPSAGWLCAPSLLPARAVRRSRCGTATRGLQGGGARLHGSAAPRLYGRCLCWVETRVFQCPRPLGPAFYSLMEFSPLMMPFTRMLLPGVRRARCSLFKASF